MRLNLKPFAHSLVIAALGVLCLSGTSARAAQPDPQDSPAEKQRKLIGVLQSDAAPQEKALTCKFLAIYGTAEAVPVLAPLLTDPELSSWARIALEAIPGSAADEALRAALAKVQGRLLVGVINSLGRRHDARAVPDLVKLLPAGDPEVASAAAAALGSIGGDPAAKALERALTEERPAVRAEVAEACVRCAERYLAEMKNAAAVRLYDLVRQAKVPQQRMLEATRGAILARQTAGIPLLIEMLESPDKALLSIGLRTARELPGRPVTEALAAQLDKTIPERQPSLLLVLADRRDDAALPALTKMARGGPSAVRIAAVEALERLNQLSTVPTLLECATADDPAVARRGKTALARMSGKEVDNDLQARLSNATPRTRQVLLELAGQRHLTQALPAILRSTEDPNQGVRYAAVEALGLVGEPAQVTDLVRLAQKTADPKDRDAIERALGNITGRLGPSSVEPLLVLAKHSDPTLRLMAVQTLPGAGGPAALQAIIKLTADADESVQDDAVRALSTWSNNWPDDASVAQPLLQLAASGKKRSHQLLCLRGYLQYLQGTKALADEEKVARIKDVNALLTTSEAKKSAIGVLSGLLTASSLEQLTLFASDPDATEEACSGIVNLAGRENLKDASNELRQRSLELVLEKTATDRTRRRAQEALKKLR
jgi:HEAT repeat protein